MKIEEKIQNFAPVVITLESEEEVFALRNAVYETLEPSLKRLGQDLNKISQSYIPF